MRLLDTSTGELKTFEGNVPQKYSILSHRWDTDNEVSYQDYKPNMESNSSGYIKIKKLCEIAKREGSDYAWIDTCCIDKTSSAELTESINSMFAWYKASCTCYAYLNDVDSRRDWKESEWWGRGWTLQEMIAPKEVIFLNRNWEVIARKTEQADEIEAFTQIPAEVLRGAPLKHYTVAQRMSWASGRQTTRVEDKAYSLLGLFQIQMPPIYGEGNKAFQRLQLNILQKFPDMSIFAWKSMSEEPRLVLATSADEFLDCANMKPYGYYKSGIGRQIPEPPRFNPPRVTSWGIELHANARKVEPQEDVIINGRIQSFLWSIQLTIAVNCGFKELPCNIILGQSGPSPYSYCCVDCIFLPADQAVRYLKQNYLVRKLETDVLFYLLFDEDVIV